MDEKLKVIENVNLGKKVGKKSKYQSDPIAQNLVRYVNSDKGEKFSVKDLL